jgi:CRP-like cAMP-binding protein
MEHSSAFLAGLSLFSGLDEGFLASALPRARVQTYKKKETLFAREDVGEMLYVLKEGDVKLSRAAMDGKEMVLSVSHDGALLGEELLHDADVYQSTATAVGAVTVVAIPLAEAKHLLQNDARFKDNLIHYLTAQQVQQQKEREHLTLQNTPQRVGCFLLRLCVKDAVKKGAAEIELPYDKSLLAAQLGMKPETFSRALKDLEKETDVTIHGSKVVIPSVEKVSQFCCQACSDTFPCKDY